LFIVTTVKVRAIEGLKILTLFMARGKQVWFDGRPPRLIIFARTDQILPPSEHVQANSVDGGASVRVNRHYANPDGFAR
jgi:hypothetical protein